jgi:hypothetical protein
MYVHEPATSHQVEPGRDWRSDLLVAARWGLVALWLIWAGLAWWTAPRPVDPAQAGADIAANRVTSVLRAETWDGQRGFWWGFGALPQVRPDGGLLIWTTTSGQQRYAAPAHGGDPADLIGFGSSGYSPETDRLAADLRAAQARTTGATFEHATLASAANGLGLVLALVMLVMLIAGPAPARGTRFYWFWVMWLPLGSGVLWWLAVERPWSRRPPPKTRQNGLGGLALLFLVTVAAHLALFALQHLLGPSLVPGF